MDLIFSRGSSTRKDADTRTRLDSTYLTIIRYSLSIATHPARSERRRIDMRFFGPCVFAGACRMYCGVYGVLLLHFGRHLVRRSRLELQLQKLQHTILFLSRIRVQAQDTGC